MTTEVRSADCHCDIGPSLERQRKEFVNLSLLEILSELHKRCHRQMLETIAELRAEGTLEHRRGVDFRQLTEDANNEADRILEEYLNGE